MNPESAESPQNTIPESTEKNQFQVERIPLKAVIGESTNENTKVKKTTVKSEDSSVQTRKSSPIPTSRSSQITDITQAIQKEISRLIKLSEYYQSRNQKSFSAHKMEKLINKIRNLRNTLEDLEESPAPFLQNLYRQHVLGSK